MAQKAFEWHLWEQLINTGLVWMATNLLGAIKIDIDIVDMAEHQTRSKRKTLNVPFYGVRA